MLLADRAAARSILSLADRHEQLVRAAWAGEVDLAGHWSESLATVLEGAGGSRLYAAQQGKTWRALVRTFREDDAHEGLEAYQRTQPILTKSAVRAAGLSALAQPISNIVQYFESSGSTGDATPAPKAWSDYVRNTINIATGWERVFSEASVALVLINAPFAPAPHQFQRVIEYLGVPFVRPWVDNVSGDYARVLRLIDELSVDTFVGPPSRLLQLIEAAAAIGWPPIRMRTLLLMAEQCGQAFRAHLQRLTGALPLPGAYGASETGTVAVSCEYGTFHVQMHSFIVELLDSTGAARYVHDLTAPLHGELVVSTLDLPLRPLLRFRTGDRVTVKPSCCRCGRSLPELVTHGRASDQLVFDELALTQEELESAVWQGDEDDDAAVNYMVVVGHDAVRCLVTTRNGEHREAHRAMEERLQAVCSSRAWRVQAVDSLPAVASLGQFLGWKMSRVLDLRVPAVARQLPDFVRRLVDDAIAQVGELWTQRGQ
jgi:phenylacetate-CoA ligase